MGEGSRGRASLGGELLALALTFALGAALIAAVTLLPRAFPRGGLPTPATLAAYGEALAGYLAGLARGDLGENARGRPVAPELWEAARRTAELLGVSVAAALPLGLAWGALLAGARRGPLAWAAYGLLNLAISLPSFVVMLLAIEVVVSLTRATGFRLAVVQGYGLDRQHLLLPAGVLALRGGAFLARAVQVAQEEILAQDWIRVARAKGLGGLGLWRRHVLPALGLPLLGGALAMLRVMVGGLVIVDYLYNWGGLGRRMLAITSGGVAAADTTLAAGAAILLLAFFIVTDALGRLALRRSPLGGRP